ncbi:MAG: efflux RND transporter permease subunit, partial [Lachnospiraceae bacterium]|nr:efflux RND transporter permease subunit [Lachnospiraceae bacterium]
EIKDTESLSTISRQNQRRYLTISAGIADGYNVTNVTAEVQNALASYDLPAGMSIEYTGENETIMEAFEQLGLMLLLGVLLVYLIMAAQFQSLKSPFIVMFTIPLAFTGGFLALLITGMELSVISLIGFVMLCGIIVNNGIVLVDYINQVRLEGMEKREAVVDAGVTRIRPILMTSITTILGLIVMAMGVGTGSEMMQPIAVVSIGGLTYATLMTLFVVPVLYEMMNRKDMIKIDETELEISSL